MSEQPIKPPGLEHLDNSDSVAPKDRVDPDILVKDAEAVAKIFNNKIQNLNPADGLFFMQQVAQNLILAPKKEETILTTTTFEKDELLNDQQKDNFSNEIHIPTKSDNQKSNNTTTKNGDKQNPAKAPTAHNNRQRKTINVNRINAWISGGNKQSPREVQKEEAKNEISSDDVIQSQVDNVVNHSSDWLKSSSQKQKDKKTLNVLILGETGVGKSTWINAFANYLIYNTLEEAITAETPICVIPTKFTLFDKNNQCHEIVLGNHENECFENEGQSATQDAKTYFFETENYNVYLIDTPGMNDTRGPREVKKEEAKNEISSDDVIQSQVDNVVNHSSDWLKSSSQKQKDKKTLNVLILGETGVGKSTWINAFANYLIYNTLEEAITAETPICVVPTKFTLFDKNNQCHEIVLGNHENECFENEGQSATQDAKTYFFETENYNVYLIDTPGMNDTRGTPCNLLPF
uniref:G domain-containing protein n=1 Tax=Panagrolaimus sp. ES5 TaxID=591445 RepID=A0AC34G1C3_9BILA